MWSWLASALQKGFGVPSGDDSSQESSRSMDGGMASVAPQNSMRLKS